MTKWLVNTFVKNNEEIERPSVRSAYGTLSCIVGIICNLLLCAIKVSGGLLVSSISIMADGMNNLADAGSSIIGLIGLKMAKKPADEEHPFGHGRIEYITALIVAFIILQMALTFFKESIDSIRYSKELYFNVVLVALLFGSMLLKLWLFFFNRKVGEKIHSTVIKATARDALGDVLITNATICSLLIWRFFGKNIDGYAGILVSVMVFFSGLQIARDTIEPLIGEAIPREMYRRLTEYVRAYDGIEGSHDLLVHNYGPGKSMASLHAEVNRDLTLEDAHEIVDNIERNCIKELGVFLVIHIDPVDVGEGMALQAKRMVKRVLYVMEPEAGIHDFQIVHNDEELVDKELDSTEISFDVIVPHSYSMEQQEKLKQKLEKTLQQRKYKCNITVEKGFVSNLEEK